jgi:spermidine synthase
VTTGVPSVYFRAPSHSFPDMLTASTRARTARGETLLFACALAFVGSGRLLVLEIVAARLIAPTLGVSLCTWTSIIGVVLGGVSLGNYLGGRIADRWPSRSTLALVYLAAALASLAILWLVPLVQAFELPTGAPVFVRVLWIAAVLFFLPSTVLGAPTPLLTRLALHSVDRAGSVVGRIQAAASLGSIAGAFLTGFLLLSWIGTRAIVAGVAGTLLVLAALSRSGTFGGREYLLLGLFGAATIVSGFASRSPCTVESDYYCIRIVDDVAHGKKHRDLYLDQLLNGIVDLDDPAKPVYFYQRFYQSAIEKVYPAGAAVDAFLIGGGAYTFPRYLKKRFQGRIVVAEIDPQVTAVARRYLGLDDTRGMRIVHEDARRVLESLASTEKFDLILGDAFNDFSVPYHLTTREFMERVSSHLKPNGLYLVNIIDGVDFDFLRSEVATLQLTFPYVGLMAFPFSLPPNHERRTFVAIASQKAPATRLPTIFESARILEGTDLARLLEHAGPARPMFEFLAYTGLLRRVRAAAREALKDPHLMASGSGSPVVHGRSARVSWHRL